MELRLKVSPLYQRILKCTKRILLLRGGSSSTKTYSVLQAIMQWLATGQFLQDAPLKDGIFSVFRKYSATLDKSVLRDFQDITNKTEAIDKLVKQGIIKQNKSNKTFTYDDGTNKRLVEFCGADDEQKLRGPRRDYLFCNEANELNFKKEFHQLNIRTRRRVIVDFNPDDIDCWLNTELEQKRAVTEGDVDIVTSTYKDNPFLTDVERQEIESLKNVDDLLWIVYAKGEYGTPKGRVFKNVNYNPSGVPLDAKLIAHGLDFGYTNHPTALIAVYLGKNKGGMDDERDSLFFEEILYETRLTNDDIADRLDATGFDVQDEVLADSAEPKSIEELCRRGYNVKPAKKGRDSVNYGIDIMKQYKLWVAGNSPNIMKEFRKYKWLEDKNGDFVNVPIDKFNHAIDAIRYVCMERLIKTVPRKTKVSVGTKENPCNVYD